MSRIKRYRARYGKKYATYRAQMRLPSPFSHPALFIASWGGSGYFPLPGTVGTLTALPFIWLALYVAGFWGLVFFTLFTLILGVWAARYIEESTGVKDHSAIVIDEVMGMALVAFVIPTDGPFLALFWLTGVLLFRVCDLLKPWPAGWLDRHLEGGWGVMLDDAAAAIYAIAVMAAMRFALGV